MSRPLVLLIATVLVGCTSAVGAARDLDGPTDDRMLAQVRAAYEAGERELTISSPGGRESTALSIAEFIEAKGITLVVDGMCTSACAQYLLVAAKRVTMRPGSVVAFHVNSFGLLAGGYLAGRDTRISSEMTDTAARASRLYQRRKVETSLMTDATRAMNLTCFRSTATSERVEGAFDTWVPPVSYLRFSGLRIGGFPESDDAALGAARLRYKEATRIRIGSIARVARSHGLPTCRS